MIVLGVDPGFASFGWAVVRLRGPRVELVALGVIRTAKATKKRHVRATDDNLERTREISEALGRLLGAWKPTAIAAESMSFPRSASVAAKMAMAWGALIVRAQVAGVPIVQSTPQEVKHAVCASKSASKEDVQAAVAARFSGLVALLEALPKGMHEHPTDAAAAVLACLPSEALRMAQRLSA